MFAALPRSDTKPLAKALLARFGSFADVIAAPRARLLEMKRVRQAVANHPKSWKPPPTAWPGPR